MIRALIALALAAPLFAAPVTIKVRLTETEGGEVVALPLERYVAAVVAGESGVFRSEEALKAVAVAARTYALRLRGRHAAEGFDFCATTHCQRASVRAITPRVEAAAARTAGELLWFEGRLAFAYYSRDCGGQTEDAASVWPELRAPYLKSHADPYCRRAGASDWRWEVRGPELAAALGRSGLRAPRTLERIVVSRRTASGRAQILQLMGGGESIPISASSLRFAAGRALGWNTLRSDRYEVRSPGGALVFEGSGAGHGVGLCQRGADQMGSQGRSHREILAFYYPGTVVGRTASGLRWIRFGGESISVLAMESDSARVVLAASERLSRALVARTGLALPANIEIRVYPDVGVFRDATGEPGWVAARTHGARIDLQPVPVLESRGALETTLRHELIHVLIEHRARPGLPPWFREGLAEYFDSASPSAGAGSARPDEAGLRQRDDAERARRAYRDARARVAALVKQHGEAAVLSWLDRGLPPEAIRK